MDIYKLRNSIFFHIQYQCLIIYTRIHNNDTGMSKSKIVCEECQDGTKMETR